MTAILVLTGASGSGKTTLMRAVEAMEIPAVACFQCDTIYQSLPEELRADGEVAQDAILDYWVKHALDRPAIELAVLETQIRPHKAQAMLRRFGVAVHRVVLVECEQAEREPASAGRGRNQNWPIQKWKTGPPKCAGKPTRWRWISSILRGCQSLPYRSG